MWLTKIDEIGIACVLEVMRRYDGDVAGVTEKHKSAWIVLAHYP